MGFTDDELRSMTPLITDRQSLIEYLSSERQYTLREDHPYWRLNQSDDALHAFVDAAMARDLVRVDKTAATP